MTTGISWGLMWNGGRGGVCFLYERIFQDVCVAGSLVSRGGFAAGGGFERGNPVVGDGDFVFVFFAAALEDAAVRAKSRMAIAGKCRDGFRGVRVGLLVGLRGCGAGIVFRGVRPDGDGGRGGDGFFAGTGGFCGVGFFGDERGDVGVGTVFVSLGSGV